MRLIDADALLEKIPADDILLSTDVRKMIVDAPTIEGEELDRIIDGIDYEWLLDQEY